jgi:hypothetical protein
MRFAVLAFLATVPTALGADADPLLGKIKAVSKEGAGNQEAGAAWKELVGLGGPALFPTLTAMNDATPLAANWLRSAVNAVAEKERAAGRQLPADKLEAFVKDAKNAAVGRRIAYELLTEQDPKTPERMLPGMLNDPSGEIRRDAIEAALRKVEKLEGEAAKVEYTRLFEVSRDEDQAKEIAKSLEKLGSKPDLVKHFNVITRWMLIGPFDSPKGAGFAKAFEPETKVDLGATYTGKGDAQVKMVFRTVMAVLGYSVPEGAVTVKVKWTPHTTTEGGGSVDLKKVFSHPKDAVAYAYTVLESDKDQDVQIRFGSITAIKLFLNGKQLFAREEYHHGSRFDQYMVPAKLKAGKNELLVKCVQNDQKEQFAQVWFFQARVCDATGGAVPIKVVLKDK